MRAAAGRPATLFWQLVDDAGAELTPDGGTHVTLSITAGDGTALYTGQIASYVSGDHVWEWTLPPQAQLDTLTATWSGIVSGVTFTESYPVDIVATRLANPWLMRQQDPDIAAIAAAPMGKQALMILVDMIEEGIRETIGYCPVLEGFRTTWDVLRGTLNDALYVSGTVNGLPYGWGAGRMLIKDIKFPVQIYAGSINGVAMDPTKDIPKIQVQDGTLTWSDYRPWISGRYSLWGTHGITNTDGMLKWAARRLCHHFAQTTDYPDRAYSVVTQGATILFSQPSRDRPTGIPEVDAVLVRARLESYI